MCLQRLDIFNVRNIRQQTITPSASFNFIFGKNGSGKSAFVEAIFLLGRAKSFRTSHSKHAISFDFSELVISAQFCQSNAQFSHLGIRLSHTDVEIRTDQHTHLKRADLASTFPIQLIHPKSFELLDAGAQYRREFIDWGVFNHDPSFLSIWKSFKKALTQRNVLLKLKYFDQLTVWDDQFNHYGSLVHCYRKAYIDQFAEILQSTVAFFLPFNDVKLNLISGWDHTLDLACNLAIDLERDKRDGFTHSGPHRADFHILVNGRPAKDVVSRGQLKLLIISLKLAQVQFHLQHSADFGCILFDDFSAELDCENRYKVLNYLQQMQCQCFITVTERNELGDLGIIADYKLFHVKQGEFFEQIVPRET
jgi:DNA replication and repair protein RecF